MASDDLQVGTDPTDEPDTEQSSSSGAEGDLQTDSDPTVQDGSDSSASGTVSETDSTESDQETADETPTRAEYYNNLGDRSSSPQQPDIGTDGDLQTDRDPTASDGSNSRETAESSQTTDTRSTLDDNPRQKRTTTETDSDPLGESRTSFDYGDVDFQNQQNQQNRQEVSLDQLQQNYDTFNISNPDVDEAETESLNESYSSPDQPLQMTQEQTSTTVRYDRVDDLESPIPGVEAFKRGYSRRGTVTDVGDDIVPNWVEKKVQNFGEWSGKTGRNYAGDAGDVAGDIFEGTNDVSGDIINFATGGVYGQYVPYQRYGDIVDSATEKAYTGAGGLASTPADLASLGIETVEAGGQLTRDVASGDTDRVASTAESIFTGVATRSGQSARAAVENPFETFGSVVAGFGVGFAGSRLLSRTGTRIRDRVRTAGGDRVELDDIVDEDVRRNIETDGKEGDQFPGAEDPDLYQSDPAEAVRQQADRYTPESVETFFRERGFDGTTLKKTLDVEPEGPNRGRSSQGFDSAPDETGIDPDSISQSDIRSDRGGFDYESPGSFVGPELSPNFLRTSGQSSGGLSIGLPGLGGKPTGVLLRTDVENPDARTSVDFAREMARREGETTARTKPPDAVNTGEIEAVVPPGARFRDAGGSAVRNTLRKVGIGSDFYTEINGRRVPLRPVVPDDSPRRRGDTDIDDNLDLERTGDIDADDYDPYFRDQSYDDLIRRGRDNTQKTTPLPPTSIGGDDPDRSGGSSTSSRNSDRRDQDSDQTRLIDADLDGGPGSSDSRRDTRDDDSVTVFDPDVTETTGPPSSSTPPTVSDPTIPSDPDGSSTTTDLTSPPSSGTPPTRPPFLITSSPPSSPPSQQRRRDRGGMDNDLPEIVSDPETEPDDAPDYLASGWFNEFVAARAGVDRDAASESTLEEQPGLDDDLGILPVAAQVGSEEEQETFSESLSLFTGLGGGGFFETDSGDDGGGWF